MPLTPRVVVVVIDGLPVDLLDACWDELVFLRERTPNRANAVSCFPSTTGLAYSPLVAGTTPGRAEITGIRWFDRTTPTHSRFPHRGLRSYVGPDAAKMKTDTRARTFFDEDAWPTSTPVDKDSPKKREKSRDLIWALAHFTHSWDQADRRTAWKLGRALAKGRPIVFAVFPSVDEFGHTLGFTGGRPRQALLEIDRMVGEKLGSFDGEVLVTADHGLTATENHLDLRHIVEELVGPTVAFPLIGVPNPAAVVQTCARAAASRAADRAGRLRDLRDHRHAAAGVAGPAVLLLVASARPAGQHRRLAAGECSLARGRDHGARRLGGLARPRTERAQADEQCSRLRGRSPGGGAAGGSVRQGQLSHLARSLGESHRRRALRELLGPGARGSVRTSSTTAGTGAN